MKNTLLIISLLLSLPTFSGEHALGAHEHGSIKLGLAVEKNIVELDIDGPAESFIGFEYLPRTEKEKKVFNNAKNLWEKNFFQLVSFDKKLNCKVAEASFTQVLEGTESSGHSDIEAKAKISCMAPVAGTEVQVSLKKYFKNIKKLSAEILSTNTKSVEITKLVQVLKL